MDTTKIRAFAVEAREKLLVGVDERLDAMGFAADGSVSEENRPVQVEGGVRFRGRVLDDPKFFEKWSKLETDIKAHKRCEVRNAVAYTWFNRFCAIRIMAKRGFIPVALEYVGNKESRTPALVASMRAGEPLPPLTGEERNALEAIRLDDTKTTDQFAILVSALCRNTPVIFKCFGAAVDYTSMLLPRDVLAPGGLIDVLNDPETIADDDYCADELIGWLYQYYISARKQEVFDSFKDGKKAEAEDIPAATQIFTPNWIVKYMVQNSLGRLAIENGLGGDFTKDWKYLIREEDGTHPPCLKVESPEELTMADVACGSGHILLEGFRHLLEIYAEAGYSRRKAVECILQKNLFGIDLDSRARQLSQFALMLAAMSADPSFADARIMPCVLDMDGTLAEGEYHRTEIAEVLSVQDDVVINELQEAFGLMTQAHNLGSIMKFMISERTRGILSVRVAELEAEEQDERVAKYLPSFRLILGLTEKYAAMVMNPPYMGSGNMNAALKEYLEREYEAGKSDLMTAFMLLASNRVRNGGRWAMINLPSWMFLASFEDLRKKYISGEQIVGFIHNGRGVFGSDFGSITFVFSKNTPYGKGVFRRLFKEHVEVRSVEKIRSLYEDESVGKYISDQKKFIDIPGCPIGYWISDSVLEMFSRKRIGDFFESGGRFKTCNDERYLRLWWEVDSDDHDWHPYIKGGDGRKYFGNELRVVNWSSESQLLYESNGGVAKKKYWGRRGVSWGTIMTSKANFRMKGDEWFNSSSAPTIYANDDYVADERLLLGVVGYLNTNIVNELFSLFNQTASLIVSDVQKVPFEYEWVTEDVISWSERCYEIAKLDWCENEIARGFLRNPLLNCNAEDLRLVYETRIRNLDALVLERKELEESVNEHFLKIFGILGDMASTVNLQDVAMFGNPYHRYDVTNISDSIVVRRRSDAIKELISYAIGCLMGRYSLEKEGLIIASQGETLEDYWEKLGIRNEELGMTGGALGDRALPTDGLTANHQPLTTLSPDEDGIIPLIAGANAFSDNGPQRVVDFIRAAFGAEHLNENLNFVEECLGGTIEGYMVKEFWKDHKKMYQNRPIYWLFSSKKGAFQCLVYLHRMDAYTASKVRNDYLLHHIEFLRNRIASETARSAELTAKERTALKKMQQALDECLEYDSRLHVVADKMQQIDLDDGVLVNYAKFDDVLAKLK